MSNEITQSMTENEYLSALQMVFPNLQPNEYSLGVKVAKEFSLNPIKRELYLVAYGSGDKRKLSIIIGYEVFLKRAEKIGTLDGWKCETMDEDGEPVAKVTIWRKDRAHPFEWSVYLSEYEQRDFQGNVNKMWKEKPRTMLKKVCIAQAFRMCFPDELGGMPYEASELPEHMTVSLGSAKEVTTDSVQTNETTNKLIKMVIDASVPLPLFSAFLISTKKIYKGQDIRHLSDDKAQKMLDNWTLASEAFRSWTDENS